MSNIWVDLMGAEVRYVGSKYRTRTIQAGQGDALILAHGGGGHAEHYSRNAMRLAQRYRFIAFDSLWHGYSSAPDYGEAPMLRFPEQMLDVMDSSGIDAAHVGGASAGAFASLWLALHHPERVKSLILIVPGHIQYPGDATAADADEYETLRQRTNVVLDNPNPEAIRTRLEWLMYDPSVVTDELVDVRTKIYGSADGNRAVRAYYAMTNSPQGHAHDFTAEDLGQISVPTLVMSSEGGSGVAAEKGPWLASAIPGARHAVIPNAGHWPQWEHPEAHDDAILTFLKDVG